MVKLARLDTYESGLDGHVLDTDFRGSRSVSLQQKIEDIQDLVEHIVGHEEKTDPLNVSWEERSAA